MSIIDKIHKWSSDKIEERLSHRFGGIQYCPWCKQIAQSKPNWYFAEWDRDKFLDKLTCGVCGGTSLWKFELGMTYIGPLDPPVPTPKMPYYDIEKAKLNYETS